jgi:hypothetical protein
MASMHSCAEGEVHEKHGLKKTKIYVQIILRDFPNGVMAKKSYPKSK